MQKVIKDCLAVAFLDKDKIVVFENEKNYIFEYRKSHQATEILNELYDLIKNIEHDLVVTIGNTSVVVQVYQITYINKKHELYNKFFYNNQAESYVVFKKKTTILENMSKPNNVPNFMVEIIKESSPIYKAFNKIIQKEINLQENDIKMQ
ncbi:MAG: hypothetical protein QXS90_01275 [Candidatus Diapherotrites archaeon]